ncbi:hypothetical protein VPH35_080109 [Triticum aestivum]
MRPPPSRLAATQRCATRSSSRPPPCCLPFPPPPLPPRSRSSATSSARPLRSSLLRSMPPSMAPRLHALAFKLALASSPFSASCLITMYSRSRLPDAAHHLFDEIPVAYRDPVCYSSTIVGLAKNGRRQESLSVFVGMRSNVVASTRNALSGALRAAAAVDALEQACGIHAHALVIRLDGNVSVGTALRDAYGKAGLWKMHGRCLRDWVMMGT